MQVRITSDTKLDEVMRSLNREGGGSNDNIDHSLEARQKSQQEGTKNK